MHLIAQTFNVFPKQDSVSLRQAISCTTLQDQCEPTSGDIFTICRHLEHLNHVRSTVSMGFEC